MSITFFLLGAFVVIAIIFYFLLAGNYYQMEYFIKGSFWICIICLVLYFVFWGLSKLVETQKGSTPTMKNGNESSYGFLLEPKHRFFRSFEFRNVEESNQLQIAT